MHAATVQPAAVPARARDGQRSDEELARAAGRGDVAAFEALYERYHVALLSFARHMLGRAHDAEDVVQHTFLAADRAFRAGKVPKAVRAWLYTVARNRCVSVLRARRDEHGLPDAALPATENLAAEVEQREDLRHLLADVRALPEDQRAALLLAELGDLSHVEVAKVIGVRPAKVKALVFQAREALMAAAGARAIPCRSIREELAVASGAGLRRRHLRNHLTQCEGCRDYAAAVRAQRAALAVVLPVIPTVALRDSVLSSLAAGGGAATATAGAGFGAGALAIKTTAAKVLTIAAVGGAAAGGGTVAVTSIDGGPDRATPPAQERTVPAGDPAGGSPAPAAATAPADGAGRPAAPAVERRRVGEGRPGARDRRRGRGRERGRGAPGTPGERRNPDAPAGRDGAPRGNANGHGKQAERGDAPPGQARRGGGDARGRAKAETRRQAPVIVPAHARDGESGAPPHARDGESGPPPQAKAKVKEPVVVLEEAAAPPVEPAPAEETAERAPAAEQGRENAAAAR